MRKSEHYKAAMLAVLDSEKMAREIKLEILDTLMQDRRAALYGEEREAKEAADK